jgi:5-methyltetrahydropteroyltriglutamate--homocysteine methyltransferase
MGEESLTLSRADHTGALRRPDWLLGVYERRADGSATDEEVKAAQDKAVAEVIAEQEEIGLPVVSDGELRRYGGFQQSFGGAVSGFAAEPYSYRRRRQEPREGGDAPGRIESGLSGPGPAISNRLPVTEKLKLVENLIGKEYAYASSVASVPVKVTLIGPDRISQRFEYENSRDVYADMDEFLADVVTIERQMISELVALGCRYVQFDEPGYTAYVDPPLLARMRDRGEDPDANLERSIRAENAIMEGFDDVTFGVHICRGGPGGRGGTGWHREGSYDAIAERLFNRLNAQRFLLEYDSEAAGSFDALRFMPEGKIAVLGLVSNHGEVETADYLRQRLGEASKFIPLEQVAICPRCGLGGSPTEDVQWGKLRVIQEVVEETWRT